MEILSSLLIGKPLNIFSIAVVFLAGNFLLRFSRMVSKRHPRALLVAAPAWGFYAVWGWLVLIRTPEVNIRVDLLLIWPIIFIVTIWFARRAFR